MPARHHISAAATGQHITFAVAASTPRALLLITKRHGRYCSLPMRVALGSAGPLSMCGWRRHSALRDSFARHQIIRCDAALTERARSPMRAMAAATTCRVTALLITQSFDSALLWAAQARLSTCATAAATARRVTALLVTQAIDSALLWAARHACQRVQRRRQQHVA